MASNLTQTYKPTLLQRLLGRNYKWWYIVRYYYKAQLYYRTNSFLLVTSQVVGFGGSLLVWYLAAQGNPNYNIKEIITYLWLGFGYGSLVSSWLSEDLGFEIQTGKITGKLMQPTSIFWANFCEFIGKSVMGEFSIALLPLILSLPIVWSQLLPPSSLINFLLMFLFIPITFFIKHCVETLVGSVGFWSTSYNGAVSAKSAVAFLLEGGKIPLSVLVTFVPWIIYQPFAFNLHHPMQIYLGKYTSIETLYVFGGGIGWCLVLYFLAKVVFRAGLKKNESVGL